MKAIERATYQQYNAKPPGKRPNFKKLSTTSPFAADWNSLLTLQSTELLLIEQLLSSSSSKSLADSPPQEGKDSTKKEEMDVDEEEEEEEEEDDKKPKDQKSKKEDQTATTKDKESKKAADVVEKNEEVLAKEDAEAVRGKVLPYYILRGRELYDLIGEQKARAQQRRRHQVQQQHQQGRVEWQEKKKEEDDSIPMDTTQQQQEEEEGKVTLPDSSTTTSVEERVSVALLSSCFVGVTIRMAKRGTPAFNSMICRPTAEDIRLWRAEPSRFEPVISEVDCREVQYPSPPQKHYGTQLSSLPPTHSQPQQQQQQQQRM